MKTIRIYQEKENNLGCMFNKRKRHDLRLIKQQKLMNIQMLGPT